MRLPQTVEVVTDGAWSEDSEGNSIRADGSTRTYKGRLYRQFAVETEGARTVESVKWKLLLHAGAVIGANDRVIVDGHTYQVDGEPYRVFGLNTVHHIQVALKP